MVPPAEDSIGVNSMKNYSWLDLFVREIFFVVLVSVIAITSKFLFVQLKRCCKSSKLLLGEHEFI